MAVEEVRRLEVGEVEVVAVVQLAVLAALRAGQQQQEAVRLPDACVSR